MSQERPGELGVPKENTATASGKLISNCTTTNWMISYLDDRSRFITGLVKIWNPTGEERDAAA
jgi:hypothetical protein